MKKVLGIGAFAGALACVSCLPDSVKAPDGRTAYVMSCEKLIDCINQGRSRCSSLRRHEIDLKPKDIEVWSGDVKGSLWSYELADDGNSWVEPGSVSLVVRKDENGKPLHDGIRLAISCNE